MTEYLKAISGALYLGADLANNGSIAVAYPAGTTRGDWALTDLTTASASLDVGQSVVHYPGVTLVVDTQLTITNASGVTWPKGAKLTVSARQPKLNLVSLTQANYDALPAKDASTIYITVT